MSKVKIKFEFVLQMIDEIDSYLERFKNITFLLNDKMAVFSIWYKLIRDIK